MNQDDNELGTSSSEAAPQRAPSKKTERPTFTFVDEQDPNVKSIIRRHSTYHSKANLRDARLQSLKTTNRPRILQWQKRHVESNEEASASTRSLSISPAPQTGNLDVDENPCAPNEVGEQDGDHVLSEFEDHQQYMMDHFCAHTNARTLLSHILLSVCEDEACKYLFSAYVLRTQEQLRSDCDKEYLRNRSHELFGQGTVLLRSKLEEDMTAASDDSIQAVLLLIAYAADFEHQDEVLIHKNALRAMIDQRRRLAYSTMPQTLSTQIEALDVSRKYHLTLGCVPDCPSPLRFPPG